MLITAQFFIQPKGHREPRNEVGLQLKAERISRILAGPLLILNVTSYPTVLLSLHFLIYNNIQ